MKKLAICILVSLLTSLATESNAGEKAGRGESFKFVFGKEPVVILFIES